jgi:hypothetical protein
MILVSRLERDLSERSLQNYIYIPLTLRFTPPDQTMPRIDGIALVAVPGALFVSNLFEMDVNFETWIVCCLLGA